MAIFFYLLSRVFARNLLREEIAEEIPGTRTLAFKVDSERQIFWRNFSWQFFLFTLRVFARNLLREEIAEEILFVFRFDVWPGTRTLAFRLISQHTTY